MKTCLSGYIYCFVGHFALKYMLVRSMQPWLTCRLSGLSPVILWLIRPLSWWPVMSERCSALRMWTISKLLLLVMGKFNDISFLVNIACLHPFSHFFVELIFVQLVLPVQFGWIRRHVCQIYSKITSIVSSRGLAMKRKWGPNFEDFLFLHKRQNNEALQ